jgi:quercetin dioxygenase-like cupin family protein
MLMRLVRRYPTARRLELRADSEALEAEMSRMPDSWWTRHLGPYHDGAWEMLSLISPSGDLSNQTSRGGAFAPTAALKQSPAFQKVLDELPGEKNRVRLMRLRPGGQIFRHSDPMEDIDPRMVRLHLPVLTNDAVRFLVDGQRVRMSPGELWHVDVRFPHEVHNEGHTMRVHLVADLLRCRELDDLLAAGQSLSEGSLTWYFLRHVIPRPIRNRIGLGN